MTQYDAGPGDWSDREWESPDWEPQSHTKRRRVALPPWALLAILAAVIILVCVGLIMAVRAIRGGGDSGTPTAVATATAEIAPTATISIIVPTTVIPQTTPTVVLPTESATEPAPPAEIGSGATVMVKGTGGTGLNLRSRPTTQSRRVATAKEGTELTVLEGPETGEGYVWWKLRTPDGAEGWGAGQWLVLKPEP